MRQERKKFTIPLFLKLSNVGYEMAYMNEYLKIQSSICTNMVY
jgi:hypothetical protein